MVVESNNRLLWITLLLRKSLFFTVIVVIEIFLRKEEVSD
jgi:hypothetical protein